jgi:hypothetical protein
MRRAFLVLGIVVTATLAASPTGVAAPPAGGCPPIFALMTFEEVENLVLANGGSGEGLREFLATTDLNADQSVCVKDLPNTPGNPPWAFIAIDNVAHLP